MITKSGLGLAASAALFALTSTAVTTTVSAADSASVHCYGVNNCKGMSDCKTTKHDCKAQNACKGQGFKQMSAKECTAAGGKTSEAM